MKTVGAISKLLLLEEQPEKGRGKGMVVWKDVQCQWRKLQRVMEDNTSSPQRHRPRLSSRRERQEIT
jgi:hypothetical protein